MYHNGAQRYEQFLRVSQLYRALILLDLALFSSEDLCIFGLHGAVYIFWLHCLPFSELSLVGLALDLVY